MCTIKSMVCNHQGGGPWRPWSRRYLGLRPAATASLVVPAILLQAPVITLLLLLPSVRPSCTRFITFASFTVYDFCLWSFVVNRRSIIARLSNHFCAIVQCYLTLLNIDFDSFNLIMNNVTGHQYLWVPKLLINFFSKIFCCRPIVY